MPTDRTLTWDGLVNGRDLGGLPLTAGGATRSGRLLRSASPHTLTTKGWRQALAAGVRTVVDLRHGFEIERHPVDDGLLPDEVRRVALSLEPPGYIESWQQRGDGWKLGTPYYYGEFLSHHADRLVSVLETITQATNGAVLVHCAGGRDRCGLVAAMTLDLVGVDLDAIVEDHWLSYDRPVSIEHELGYTPAGQPAAHDPTLTRSGHGAALRAVLATHPARSLFASPEHADEVAGALRRMLVP